MCIFVHVICRLSISFSILFISNAMKCISAIESIGKLSWSHCNDKRVLTLLKWTRMIANVKWKTIAKSITTITTKTKNNQRILYVYYKPFKGWQQLKRDTKKYGEIEWMHNWDVHFVCVCEFSEKNGAAKAFETCPINFIRWHILFFDKRILRSILSKVLMVYTFGICFFLSLCILHSRFEFLS